MSAIRSFVTVKPFKSTTAVGTNMNGLRKSVNRLGMTTEGIGKSIEQMSIITQFQKDYLMDEVKEENKYNAEQDKKKKLIASRLKIQKKREKQRVKRDMSEDIAEKVNEGKEITKQEENKKRELGPFMKIMNSIGGFFSSIFGAFVLFGGLSWMQKNGEAIKTVFKIVASLVKFAYKITRMGVGFIGDGLTRMFGDYSDLNEGKINRTFRFFKGALQLLTGLAVLRSAQYIIMPWKLFSDVGKLTNIFSEAKQVEQGTQQAQARVKDGYYDKKTNRFYTKQEYETMRKAARKQPGGIKAFNDRVRPTSKISGAKMGASRRIGNAFKGIKGRIPGGGATMLAGATSAVGGLARAFGGDRPGEAAGTAVGAGVGKAVGGIAGAAAGAAFLPFLGPFGPMIGAAIGDFLGDFIGSKIGPIIQPIFEPIARTFNMMKEVFLAPLMPLIEPMKELIGTFFKALGNIVGTIMKAITPIMKFVGLVLGGAIKTIFKVLSFTFNLIKNIVAFTLNPIGFAWDVIRRKDPGRDIELDQVANAKGADKKPDLEQFDKGGKFTKPERISGDVDKKKVIKPKIIRQRPNIEQPAQMAAGGVIQAAGGMDFMPPNIALMLKATDMVGISLQNAIVGGINMFGVFSPPVKRVLGPEMQQVSQAFGRGVGSSGAAASGVRALPTPQVDTMREERQKPRSSLGTTFSMIAKGRYSMIGILKDGIKKLEERQNRVGVVGSQETDASAEMRGGSGTTGGGGYGGGQTPVTPGNTSTAGGKWTPLLELIAAKEAVNGSYDSIYPSTTKQKYSGGKPLTEMTIQEADDWQGQTYRARGSSAAGRYQFMYIKNMAMRYANLSPDDMFNEENQDKMAIGLIEQKAGGGISWKMAKENPDEAMKRLAMEWASFPVPYDMQGAHRYVTAGQSYYAGDGMNAAGVGVSAVKELLAQMDGGGEFDENGRPKHPALLRRMAQSKVLDMVQGIKDRLREFADGGELAKLGDGTRLVSVGRGLCTTGVILTAEANRASIGKPHVATGNDRNNPRGLMAQAVGEHGYASIEGLGKKKLITSPYGNVNVNVMNFKEWTAAVKGKKIPSGALIFSTRHNDWNNDASSSGNDSAIAKNGGASLWSGHWQTEVGGVGAVYGTGTRGIVALTHPGGNKSGYTGKGGSASGLKPGSASTTDGSAGTGGGSTETATQVNQPVTTATIKDLMTKIANIFRKVKRKKEPKPQQTVTDAIDNYQQIENNNEKDQEAMREGAQIEEELKQGDMTPTVVPLATPVPINSGGSGGGGSPQQIIMPLTPGILRR